MELEPWFKLKKYPHIGEPITIKDYDWVKSYVNDFNKIRTHSFLPLIHKTIISRRFRPDSSNLTKNPSGKRKRVLHEPKIRDIFFPSHLDSLILSRYNELLVNAYEDYVEKSNFNKSVVAYRKIPISPGSDFNKCNIDFAKTSFEFILNNNTEELTVIVADVTSFFDNLNHENLKKQWRKVLGKTKLPDDHYNIFKMLTNIKYVEGDQLFKRLNNTVLVKKGVANSAKNKVIIRKRLNNIKYFKEKNVVAFCKKDDFLKNHLNLIISKNNKVGIPQGTPLSATLANIYMLDFDQVIFDHVSLIDGFYQRYSDDLLIICKKQHEDDIIRLIREKIDTLVNLKIESKKTKIYRFENVSGKFTGFEIDEITKRKNSNKTLEYLGFSFDGQRVLIKNSGFSKFYRNMKSSLRKSISLALFSKNPDKSLFKSRLYKRFTHKGANRKLIFRPSKSDKTIYVKSKEYYWGNYLSYINKANDSMRTINRGNVIKKQSRKFWKRFNDLIKFHEKRISSTLGNSKSDSLPKFFKHRYKNEGRRIN